MYKGFGSQRLFLFLFLFFRIFVLENCLTVENILLKR